MLTAKTNVSVAKPKKLVRLQRSSTLAFLCLGHSVFSFYGKKSKVRIIQWQQWQLQPLTPQVIFYLDQKEAIIFFRKYFIPLKKKFRYLRFKTHAQGTKITARSWVSLLKYPAQPHFQVRTCYFKTIVTKCVQYTATPDLMETEMTNLSLVSSLPTCQYLSNKSSAYKTTNQTDFRGFVSLL